MMNKTLNNEDSNILLKLRLIGLRFNDWLKNLPEDFWYCLILASILLLISYDQDFKIKAIVVSFSCSFILIHFLHFNFTLFRKIFNLITSWIYTLSMSFGAYLCLVNANKENYVWLAILLSILSTLALLFWFSKSFKNALIFRENLGDKPIFHMFSTILYFSFMLDFWIYLFYFLF